jgi:hypothetical protein
MCTDLKVRCIEVDGHGFFGRKDSILVCTILAPFYL